MIRQCSGRRTAVDAEGAHSASPSSGSMSPHCAPSKNATVCPAVSEARSTQLPAEGIHAASIDVLRASGTCSDHRGSGRGPRHTHRAWPPPERPERLAGGWPSTTVPDGEPQEWPDNWTDSSVGLCGSSRPLAHLPTPSWMSDIHSATVSTQSNSTSLPGPTRLLWRCQ